MSSTTNVAGKENPALEAAFAAATTAEPVPDSLPSWRREMEASLSAHRRNAALAVAIPLPAAGSTAAPAVHDEPRMGNVTLRSRRRGREFLYLSLGLGVAAMLAFAALVALNSTAGEATKAVKNAPPFTVTGI